LHGITGERLKQILDVTAEALKARQQSITPTYDLDQALNVSLKVFSRIIDSLSKAKVNETLHAPMNTIGDVLVAQVTTGDTCSTDAHEASISLTYIQKRLDIGLSLPSLRSNRGAAQTKATFKIEREPPGGRHDNDHENIEKIQILPTPDEISSVHVEYLPVQDASENHLQGIDGLLDRSFRLLREDTVGQLRDAVQDESQRLPSQSPLNSKAGARINTYHNIQFDTMNYDNRKTLSFIVSFDQPLSIADGKERKEWWLKSKRLEPEVLVCLVDSQGSILFCTVSQNSKPKGGGDGPPYAKNKETELQFKQLHGNQQQARISLHVAASSQLALRPLVAWLTTHCQRSPVVLSSSQVFCYCFQAHLGGAAEDQSEVTDGIVRVLDPTRGRQC
jgi:hypothetical protein